MPVSIYTHLVEVHYIAVSGPACCNKQLQSPLLWIPGGTENELLPEISMDAIGRGRQLCRTVRANNRSKKFVEICEHGKGNECNCMSRAELRSSTELLA